MHLNIGLEKCIIFQNIAFESLKLTNVIILMAHLLDRQPDNKYSLPLQFGKLERNQKTLFKGRSRQLNNPHLFILEKNILERAEEGMGN